MRRHSKLQKVGLLVLVITVSVFMLLPRTAFAEPEPVPEIASTNLHNAESACQASHTLSWILCWVVLGGAGIGDAIYSFIEDSLVIDVNNFGDGAKQVWGVFRDIANIGFVVIFLIVIFSHLTGVGISAYHIKKMLPKIIACAILINLSFFVTQVLVEVSNIVGSSIRDLFKGIEETIRSAAPATTTTAAGNFNISETIAAIIIYFVAKNASVSFFVQFVAPVIIFIVVTLLTTILILVARQAIVIFLTILSPLAFLSIVTPNTESLFQSWKKILIGVLVSYPVIGLIFGASGLAGRLLDGIAVGNWWLEIMAQIVRVIPLIAAPAAIKNSIAAVPMIGGKVAGLTSKLQKKTWSAARKSPLSTRFKAAHESQLRRRKLGRFSDFEADGTEKSRVGKAAARMRRRWLPGREAELQKGIADETQAMAMAMTDNDVEVLSKLGDDELTNEHISQMSAGVRTLYYNSGGNKAMLYTAAAEQLSSKGRLRAEGEKGYRTFMQRAANSKGYTNQMAFDASNRILTNAKAKGAYDTAAYIDNINQTAGGNIRTGISNELTEEVAGTYLDRLSADELAKISAGALATGSATANAFVQRDAPDSAFRQIVDTAIRSGNMNAEAYSQIEDLRSESRDKWGVKDKAREARRNRRGRI